MMYFVPPKPQSQPRRWTVIKPDGDRVPCVDAEDAQRVAHYAGVYAGRATISTDALARTITVSATPAAVPVRSTRA